MKNHTQLRQQLFMSKGGSQMDKKPELEDLIKHYGVKGMKWRQTKENDQYEEEDHNSIEGFAKAIINGSDERRKEILKDFIRDLKAISKDGIKKVGKIDDVLKKYGNKTLNSLFPKTGGKTVTVSTSVAGGKWYDKTYKNGKLVKSTRPKPKPAKGSKEWYEARLKRETSAQTRKRLKKEWKNVPNASPLDMFLPQKRK